MSNVDDRLATGNLPRSAGDCTFLESLGALLKVAGYGRIPLVQNAVGHFESPGALNGRLVRVLIDTGAASTVINRALADELRLEMTVLGRKGGGAGGVSLEVAETVGADLRIGDVAPRLPRSVVMDLTHVNTALLARKAEPVDVVVGGDVLSAHAAIIDYGSSTLFLRQPA